ncbi:MAG: hypothetical protein HZC28_13995 [Spirochaetes bacterium]|nr:hypothetical protein [Spirochaetota bacterium]
MKPALTGILLLITILSGIWLSNSGKPLNTVIFTIHKLIALASVVFAVLAVIAFRERIAVSPLLPALLIIIGICFLILFITGAFLSFNKTMPGAVITLHRIAPALASCAALLAAYMLFFKR